MQQAGVRAGDVIEAVGGRIVVGQTDWFLARAHFERDKPIEIQVRRGQDRLHLSFTIGTPNWRTLSSGEIAFQATRVFVLLLAIVIALARPEQLEATLVALMFAMIAVAEAFPPTGWAASLRQLPVMLSIPIALASVSWLLITVPWVSLSVRFPQPVPVRPWFWRLVLSPLIIFVPLIMMSAATVVYGPAALAMPSPFLDSVVIRRVQSIWGVMPSLFINPWPFYTPARQNFLLALWVSISILAFATGFVMFVVNSRAAQVESRRHKPRMVLSVTMVMVVAVHNVVVRNWENLFGTAPPAAFSTAGLVMEAVAFSLVALSLAYTVVSRRS
jgi:hypothetical protein